ncbi:Clp protease N-terminal domain-containing protein [Zavarzinella formosa]|uniref:Clp protease N-terminal domain-containing protein n=1 Tax=Zavarzinella formosa TaxID=360055 RepID=UPI0002D32804|nr:Clp protease N-terminal domain-containing protein [Zavarzinella formosa]
MTDIFLLGGPLDETKFAPATRGMLQAAVQATIDTRWETIRSPHLFMGMLAEPDGMISTWCESLETTPEKLRRQFSRLFFQPSDEIPFVRLHREFCSTNTLEIIRAAGRRAVEQRQQLIRPSDLFWTLLADDGCVAACFRESGYSASVLRVMLGAAEADLARRVASQTV